MNKKILTRMGTKWMLAGCGMLLLSIGCGSEGPLAEKAKTARDEESICVGKCDGLATREASVSEQQALMRLAPEGCNAELLYVQSSYEFSTGTTTVKLAMLSDRPLRELRRIGDPQSWDLTASQYFASTYLIADRRSLAPRNPPPELGSNWEGILYEDVSFALLSFDVSQLHNLLGFRSRRFDPPRDGVLAHRFDFWLDTSIDMTFLGITYDGGIDLDEGYMTIEATPSGKWKFTGQKSVHFTKPPLLSGALNLSSPLVFGKFLSDLSFTLLCAPTP